MIQSAVQSVKSTLSTNPSIGACYTARFGLGKWLVPPPNSETPPVSAIRRTRWVRTLQLLFGCAWVVFAFASPVSAAVLVSNIGQNSQGQSNLSSFDVAQGFTTGSNVAGYTVTSVDVQFSSTPSGVTVKLATGLPSTTTVVATMNNPSSLSSGVNTFTAPSGTILLPSTTYFVVVEASSGNVQNTPSNDEDSGGATGWSIADQGLYRQASSTVSWSSEAAKRKIRINGTVNSGTAPPVSLDRKQVAASILTAVGAQALSGALDNIGTRIGGSLPQTSLSIAGFQMPPFSGETEQSVYERCRFGCDTQSDRSGYHSVDSDDLLQSSAFSLNLGASEGNTDISALDWSVWGRADLAAFEGRPAPAAHYDGRAKSGWFGIDGRSEQWVAGAALSKTWSETDYRLDASSGQQRMRTELTALYPYGRWALDEQSAVHAIAGIGSGEVRNARDGSVQEKSDLSMRMLSVGVERQLAPRPDGMELSVRAEASTVRLKTAAGDESIDGLTPESWRIRMGLEGSRRISRDDGTVMEPFFDLAVRRDGGDGVEGYGMEAAGGARYTAERVQLEFRGRVLLAHSGRGVRESGLSVTFQYLPESDGRGLSLSFRPHWGIAANGTRALWRDEMPQPEDLSDASSFDARIGYGFDLPSTGGMVTPFAENIHSSGSRTLRVGARFDAPRDNLAMELSGERRRNTEDAAPRNSIRLDFSLRF